MAEQKIGIVINASDRATPKLRGIRKALGGIASVASGFIVAQLGMKMAAGLAKLAPEAGRIADLSKSFAALARDAGISNNQLLANLRKAAAGTVSQTDLMEQANKAMLLIGEGAAQDLPQMMRIARAAAKATGQDVGFMFESIVTGIGRASPLILDNLGITMSITDAQEAYAKQLGKTVKELTEQEKAESFRKAAMAAGEALIKRTGSETLGLTEKIAQLTVKWKNFKDRMLLASLPLLTKVADGLLHLINTVETLGKYFAFTVEEGDYLNDFLADVPSFLQPIVLEAGKVVALFENFGEKLAGVGTKFKEVFDKAAPLLTLFIPGSALIKGFSLVKSAWDRDLGGIQTLVITAWAEIEKTLKEGLGGIKIGMPVLELDKLKLPGEVLQSWDRLGDIWKTAWDAFEPFRDATRTILDTLLEFAESELAQIWEDLQMAWFQLGLAWRQDLKPALDELWVALGPDVQILLRDVADLFVRLAGSAGVAAILAPLLFAAAFLKGFANAMKLLSEKIGPAIRGLTGITRGFTRLWREVKKAWQWIQDVREAMFKLPGISGAVSLAGGGSVMGVKQLGGTIPRTGPYLLHAGERVQTRSQQQAQQAPLIGSLTINANDAEGGRRAGRGFLEEVRRQLGSDIDRSERVGFGSREFDVTAYGNI